MKNSEYWAKRFEILEEAAISKGSSYFEALEAQYRESSRTIEISLSTWYQRFAVNNNISLSEARRLLNSSELKEFKWTVQDFIKYGEENAMNQQWMKELENASARVHISRLEALKIQTQQQMEVLYGNQTDGIDALARKIYSDAYYHTAYEIQKGFNVGWNLQSLNDKQLERVLSKPWTADNQTFRDKCWTQKASLVSTVQTELTQSIMRGDFPDKAIKTISEKFNVAKSKAGRLVMTESAYFSSEAQKNCFNELDVERYEIVATLDSHTSALCQSLDGQVFEMKDYQPGVTAPPFHPWCRSTTVPYFEDNYGERAARAAEGNTYYVPSNMKYADWKKKHVKDAIKYSEIKEYNKYKDILGNNTPSLERFLEIRYNNHDWNEFKAYASSLKSSELSIFADFDVYQRISKEMDDKLLGIVTINNLTITGKSKHSIARVIGSVEQRRSGVLVSDVLDALINHESEILPIKQMKNGKSQKFRNQIVEVSVNPDTGSIIQVNPIHSKKKVK